MDGMDVDDDQEATRALGQERNKFPFLTFAGIIPASEDFSKSSRKCLMEANIGQEILTNGFVLELWSLVVLNTPGENIKKRIL